MCTSCTTVCTCGIALPHSSRVRSRRAGHCRARLSSECSLRSPGRTGKAFRQAFPARLAMRCAPRCLALSDATLRAFAGLWQGLARAWSPRAASCGADGLLKALPVARVPPPGHEWPGWCAWPPRLQARRTCVAQCCLQNKALVCFQTCTKSAGSARSRTLREERMLQAGYVQPCWGATDVLQRSHGLHYGALTSAWLWSPILFYVALSLGLRELPFDACASQRRMSARRSTRAIENAGCNRSAARQDSDSSAA